MPVLRRRPALSMLAVSAAALLAPLGAAHAEDAEEIALRYASISPDERITVEGRRRDPLSLESSSATKTLTPLRDIPQAISVIDRALIDDQNVRSLIDVARYVPGLSAGLGEGHRDALTLRGNSSTADFYVDGVRDDVQYIRDFYNVERIEVLRGSNALIFGRGGGGGVINRVQKKAEFDPVRSLSLGGGSFDYWRAAGDVGGAVSEDVALRLNGFYENSGSYRDFVDLERYGINPTATVRLSPDTEVEFSYEYFNDERDVDRGVPSVNGRPFEGDRRAYFGNPDLSFMTAEVHSASVTLSHQFNDALSVRNRTVFADYDKFYQNVHARTAVGVGSSGGMPLAADEVGLQAYFSRTERQNIFNQTDFVLETDTAGAKHRILFGVEVGHQDTDNFRTENNNDAGVVTINDPTFFGPVTFAATRNDNNAGLNVLGVYLQDQIELGQHFQLIGGVRYDRFDLDFDNFIAGSMDFDRVDNRFSPRAGLVFKPVERASFYASYSVSFLPQSGDQFGSLSASTASLKPERFENYEIGAKVDIIPGLAVTAALYQLDRSNTRATDPVSNLTVLTGESRSRGFELSLSGHITDRWEVIASYALQDAEIRENTSSAPAGRQEPLVPDNSFSIWNRYQVHDRVGVALGVAYQDETFASISNAVTLPSFTRVDAAVFVQVTDNVELQVNVDNLTNGHFFETAHNDNNILPVTPRAARATLTIDF